MTTIPPSSDAFADTPVPADVCVMAEHGPVRFIESHSKQVEDTDRYVSVSASQRRDGTIDNGTEFDPPTIWLDLDVDGQRVERLVLTATETVDVIDALFDALAQVDTWTGVE